MAYSTINKSSLHQSTVLYSGTGSEQAITGVNFQPDMIWQKGRSDATSPSIHDAVRGATWEIYTSATDADANYAQTCKSFDSDGFTVGTDGGWNASGQTKVGWCWKAGTTTGITQGGAAITPSAYSFNQTAGMSIIKYSGTLTGSGNTTVPHGLGVAPKMIIFKLLSGADNWAVQNTNLTAGYYMRLNSTNAEADATGDGALPAPTSDLFTINWKGEWGNSGSDYIAYCFAEVAGYSKFGSYIGNGNADGTFIYTGFKPKFVMIKQSVGNNATNWSITDDKRNGANKYNKILYANTTASEDGSYEPIDHLSNGFKIRLNTAGYNDSGDTYIYMAFGQTIVGTNDIPATAR